MLIHEFVLFQQTHNECLFHPYINLKKRFGNQSKSRFRPTSQEAFELKTLELGSESAKTTPAL